MLSALEASDASDADDDIPSSHMDDHGGGGGIVSERDGARGFDTALAHCRRIAAAAMLGVTIADARSFAVTFQTGDASLSTELTGQTENAGIPQRSVVGLLASIDHLAAAASKSLSSASSLSAPSS